jgi:hypothetical protein
VTPNSIFSVAIFLNIPWAFENHRHQKQGLQ